MTLSKILTDIFRTANNLTHCKTTNQLCAGDASGTLASAILSCDRYSIFEQDYPRSGLIRQAVRHTGHSVHTSLVTTFNLLFKNIHLSTSLIRGSAPISSKSLTLSIKRGPLGKRKISHAKTVFCTIRYRHCVMVGTSLYPV